MAVYLFYLQQHAELRPPSTTAECPDDGAALRHAQAVLTDHASAEEIVVWRGECRVGAVQRRIPAPSAPKAAPSVLIVEDCFLQADGLRLAFKEAGYGDVRFCGNPHSVLVVLAASCPDIAVVDVDLGEGQDFQVAQMLERARIPFIFVTGYDRDGLPEQWRHIEHVSKPVSGAEVVMIADALLAAEHRFGPDGVRRSMRMPIARGPIAGEAERPPNNVDEARR